jgi:hypothetical protein
MTRNLLIIGTVAVFGLAAVIAGVGDATTAAACDDAAKSAAASSCCAKKANTASATAKDVHGSMIKSAMVAPGAAGSTIINAAAFGAMVSHADADCDWCPPEMCLNAGSAAAKDRAVYSTAGVGSSCAKDASAAKVPGACTREASTTAVHAGLAAGQASCEGKSAAAAGTSCTKDANAAAKSPSAAAASCCDAKAVKTAGTGSCSEAKSASLKGVVDELPYRESKRVVLTGEYACGHCTLHKTEECSPMLKTADGKVYPLLKSARASELKGVTGKSIEVAGTVKKVDGVKFIDLKSYKVL